MRRWHQDLPLMLRRWRDELRKYGLDPAPYLGNYRSGELTHVGICHCERGPGVLRKRRPWDCGRARCGLCHWSKIHGIPARSNRNWYAMEFEAAAAVDGLSAIHAGRLGRDTFL